jgi:hypothetical protein
MQAVAHHGLISLCAVDEGIMTFFKTTLAALALMSTLAAQATTISLNADDSWTPFIVNGDEQTAPWLDYNDGYLVNFTFSIAEGQQGTLTVVDSVFAGDTFRLYNFGAFLGDTSYVPQRTYSDSWVSTFDYDAALSDTSFSRGVFTLGAGTYSITGGLLQSNLQVDATTGALSAIYATEGAIKLSLSSTSPVPEPSSAALVLAALGVCWLISRRLPSGR